MPLERWNESVFRYYFCRFVAKTNREVKQYFECDRIDLVLELGGHLALIEFKFYGRPQRINLKTMQPRGYKGGPSKKNKDEFQKSINTLIQKESDKNFSKYVVLVFWEPKELGRKKSFDYYYKDYLRFTPDVVEVDRGWFETTSENGQVRLYKITAALK